MESYCNFDDREYRSVGNSSYALQGIDVHAFVDHSILGNSRIEKSTMIESSNICNGCVVTANIQNCILWDDVLLVQGKYFCSGLMILCSVRNAKYFCVENIYLFLAIVFELLFSWESTQNWLTYKHNKYYFIIQLCFFCS